MIIDTTFVVSLDSDASFQDFVNSPCMTEIKERSCFIHVDVPGHADNAAPLAEKWVNETLKSKTENSHVGPFPLVLR